MSINPIAARFSERLLITRRRAGLSQEELGYLSNLHRTEVGHLERGHRDPKVSTLIKLAGALGVTPNDLLDGIEWKPKTNAPLQGQFKIKED